MSSTSKAKRKRDEFDFSRSTGRGPEGMRKALEIMRASKRGRPRKDSTAQQTSVKSVRLPDAVWREIARRAKSSGTTDSAVLRDVIARGLAEKRASGAAGRRDN